MRLVLILAALPFLFVAGCGGTPAELVSVAPTEVVVARPIEREIVDYEEFTGHTDAILSVQIKARVTGYLTKKDFLDGQQVQKDDILYEVDDRPYKALLDRAEGMVAQGEAHRKRVNADYQRATNLFQRGAIGRHEFDLISSDFSEAGAILNASKAQLATARLNFEWTKIRAPMSGQLSRTLIDPGNLVRQNDTVLNDIVAVDKLYVYFDASADAMGRISLLIDQGRIGGSGNKEVPVEVGTSVDSDAHEDATSHLRDVLDQKRVPTEDEKRIPPEFPYKGLVNFAENKIDAATGTLRVRGLIDNPLSSLLCPGLFVKVRLPIGDSHPALLVPDDAIGSDQGRSFVYVVSPDNEVVYRPVQIGALFGGPAGSKLRAIREGLKADERFIQDAEALRRVRPGSTVAPKMIPART